MPIAMGIRYGGKHDCGSKEIVLDGVHRLLENEPHTDGSREMHDCIHAGDEGGDDRRVGSGANDALESRIAL